jgi:major membrane immunogen (membrane-anchored lipoprotein)
MIKNTFYLLIALSVMALSACGEKAQMLGTKNDATAYSGVTNAFIEKGWQAGDKTSWERQLNARAQYGQNDHTRSP